MIYKAISTSVILASICHAYIHLEDLKSYLKELEQDIYETDLLDDLVIGNLGNYLEAEELNDLLDSIMDTYGNEFVYEFSIGQSAEGRPIRAFAFMTGTTPEFFKSEMKERRSILIDGVHHARELTTISQVVLTMLSLMHGYEH